MSWALWITGLPGSGKSAIARALARELEADGEPVTVLELDRLRKVLTPIATYQPREREVVYRALVYIAALLVESGIPVVIDATAHRRAWRTLARAVIPTFAEVQLLCPLEICQARERSRPPGAAPRGIYAAAGRPGATVPGVDVEYEPAEAPELVIDTSRDDVTASVKRIVPLAREMRAAAQRGEGGWDACWAIWITGLPGSGKTTLAATVAENLTARGIPVRVLDLTTLREFIMAGGVATATEEEIAHRTLAYAAARLTAAGVPVIIDATAPRRAWRDLARDMVGHFAEVQLVCPPEICGDRERAARWNLGFCAQPPRRRPGAAAAPDVVIDYEPSLHPDVSIRTDVVDVGAAAREVLRITERLHQAAARPRSTRSNRKENSAMQIRDLMSRTLITVGPATSVTEARALMTRERIRHLLVTDDGRLSGLVTDRDIRLSLPSPATSLSVWELNYLLARLTVSEVMTKAVITVEPDRDARAAARLMLDHRIGALPVVEGGRLVGIVTETDLVRAFAQSDDRTSSTAARA